MDELKRMPEQNGYDSWKISPEFLGFIKGAGHYIGVVLENGENVFVDQMQNAGYYPFLPLKSYLKGIPHAILMKKYGDTYIPKGLEGKVKEVMKENFTLELNFPFVKFEKRSEELIDYFIAQESNKEKI